MLKNSYLIQRLNKPYLQEVKLPIQALMKYGLSATGLSKEAREILTKICKFDYMGSAEYEFGAIPKALHQMAQNSSHLTMFAEDINYNFKNYGLINTISGKRTVYIICDTDDKLEITTRIKTMALGEERCKERTEFAESLAEYRYGKDTVGWLDLDNGFMFFKDRVMFDNFSSLFKNK